MQFSAKSTGVSFCASRRFSLYLAHVGLGLSLRFLAAKLACHASTISRAARQVEGLRDDPLLDTALDRAARSLDRADLTAETGGKDILAMTTAALTRDTLTDSQVEREARRILRRLSEKGAFLAVTRGMEKAVIFRKGNAGQLTRTATCPTIVAEAFLLRDWISVAASGKVMRYTLTTAGASALARILAADQAAKRDEHASTPFAAQHQVEGTRNVMGQDGPLPIRVNLAESPLAALARRKDKSGRPFLAPEELEAGERLREEFERAQMGPKVAQNWERFLVPSDHGTGIAGDRMAGPQDARDRVTNAFSALGPGLADIAMRCCCFLEGLETAERRMGWSARSGKVVLKIALARLAKHYGLRAA
ncbi:DUF6456 domain-containing protein [Pontivivens insulae]|uniref:DUF6456 domain-containing protein n=1 Tax=Pontivivens insulae TaxID=1639689 RepID=A0A2R8AA83_9RHOB|nr:DUF6456 domain-containing protein [Pontivivens insulae]RED12877.1 hypothetical protein DFR53_2008 [Pontivivens insulae]SPF28968.1 hypothetical protein POI8812_01271 [Pontivivens insulae]